MNYEERKKSYPLLSQKKKGIVREQVVECKTTTEQYIHKSNKLCDRTWCFFVVREQNHEVSQFLNNPDLMRRTMEMIRYHTTIQEITRNHDRALINLESLRSGYNVRQRIYRDFQEPMLNVAHEQFGDNPLNTNSRSSSTANTSQVGTENTNLLPNPGASQNTTFQIDSSRSYVSNSNHILMSSNLEQCAENFKLLREYKINNQQQILRGNVDQLRDLNLKYEALAKQFQDNMLYIPAGHCHVLSSTVYEKLQETELQMAKLLEAYKCFTYLDWDFMDTGLDLDRSKHLIVKFSPLDYLEIRKFLITAHGLSPNSMDSTEKLSLVGRDIDYPICCLLKQSISNDVENADFEKAANTSKVLLEKLNKIESGTETVNSSFHEWSSITLILLEILIYRTGSQRDLKTFMPTTYYLSTSDSSQTTQITRIIKYIMLDLIKELKNVPPNLTKVAESLKHHMDETQERILVAICEAVEINQTDDLINEVLKLTL
ncbi:hypothetical protein GJ496_011626 [Pomphorhynchus laevis]|nr:hypothetical protein GJ496_011626 [Pomphorhynchus laevis]